MTDLCSPAKAGAQSRRAAPIALPRNSFASDWAPAFAGGRRGSVTTA